MRITEGNFVSQIMLGNEEAMAYIIQQYGWVIKTVVRKHLYQMLSYEEDCMNDILLVVWQQIDRFNPEMNSFKNWLAGVSKYTALNYLRKYKKELEQDSLELVELVTSDTTHEELIKEELSKEFEDMLNCIKEKDRELFVRLYIQEQSLDEVSQTMGLKKDVIYNRVSRAKNKIRKLFG
ncbi:MAG: sigma-70 family RNA polymerase sigma factor [Cellulosilyticaceae bacterium]